VDVEVLPCEAEGGSLDGVFPVEFMLGRQCHVVSLSESEAFALCSLEGTWGFFRRRLGEPNFSHMPVGVNRLASEIALDDQAQDAGGNSKRH